MNVLRTISVFALCIVSQSLAPVDAVVLDDPESHPPTKAVRVETGADYIYFVRYSPLGRLVLAGGQDMAALWDSTTQTLLVPLHGHRGYVHGGSFSFDGQRVVTAGSDRTAKVWNLDGTLERTLTGHADTVNDAGFSPQGDEIVTASTDGSAKIWDTSTGQEKATLTGHSGWVNSAEFSSDGSRILTAGGDGARLWDAQTRKLVKLIPHGREVKSARFSRDGKRAVTAGADQVAKILDSATGNTLVTLTGHTEAIECADYKSDGQMIMTSSPWDRTIRLWDAREGTEVARWTPVFERALYSCAFSPDGHQLAVGADNTFVIWTWAPEKDPLKQLQRDLAFPARPLQPGDPSPAEEIFQLPWDRNHLGSRF